MEEKMCVDCGFVSQDECAERRKTHDECIKQHTDWMHDKDVEDAKRAESDKWQTWILSGIFGVSLLSFLSNLFN